MNRLQRLVNDLDYQVPFLKTFVDISVNLVQFVKLAFLITFAAL